jgi:hypothetical protein
VEIPGEAKSRVSASEALWFDVLAPDTPDEHSLSGIRVAALDYSALLLGVTHLIAAIALFALHPERALAASFSNPMLPLGLLPPEGQPPGIPLDQPVSASAAP